MACPPPVRPAQQPTVPPLPTTTAPTHPTRLPAVGVVVDGHRLWLDGLSLHDRLRYDRAFGHAWFAGKSKEQCQVAARKAVEASRRVGPRSNLSLEAEQVHDHAPGALASSRPSASSPVPASFACLGVPALAPVPALSACPDTSASSASSPVPALFACPDTSASSPVPASLNVPALLACPNTSASLASLHVPASLARPGVPALSACLDTSASSPVPASLNTSASLARPSVPASAPVPALSACPHASASSHHVGAGSNISCKAEQGSDRAPGRNGRQTGQDRPHLAASVNGSFATTYAEDRDGNSRASSFCLFARRTRRKCPRNNDIPRAATDAARHDMSNTRRS